MLPKDLFEASTPLIEALDNQKTGDWRTGGDKLGALLTNSRLPLLEGRVTRELPV